MAHIVVPRAVSASNAAATTAGVTAVPFLERIAPIRETMPSCMAAVVGLYGVGVMPCRSSETTSAGLLICPGMTAPPLPNSWAAALVSVDGSWFVVLLLDRSWTMKLKASLATDALHGRFTALTRANSASAYC